MTSEVKEAAQVTRFQRASGRISETEWPGSSRDPKVDKEMLERVARRFGTDLTDGLARLPGGPVLIHGACAIMRVSVVAGKLMLLIGKDTLKVFEARFDLNKNIGIFPGAGDF